MTNEQLHEFRKQIDECVLQAEEVVFNWGKFSGAAPKYIREISIVRTKLQEAKMWVGKCLEVQGSELPKEFRDKANE